MRAAGINLGWLFKCILNLKWLPLKQIMQMLQVLPTHLPMHSSQPVRPSLGPLIDCFVLLRHGVTATLGEMPQNASPMIQWGLRIPEIPALLSFPCCWHPCSLAELRWDISAGKRRKTQHLHFNSSLVRFCCHIVLLSLHLVFLSKMRPHIISLWKHRKEDPLHTWDGRSRTFFAVE